jgi:hypothetical protein
MRKPDPFELLRDWMDARRYSLREASRRFGCSDSALRKVVIDGEPPRTLRIAQAIRDACKIPVDAWPKIDPETNAARHD